MMAQSQDVVLITGATSFIGAHVINLLLQEGWKVRGTVRKLTSDKTKALQEVFQEYAAQLELVEADLTSAQGWDAAVKGCTYVHHMACPVESQNFCKDDMMRYLKEPPEIQKTIDMVVSGTSYVLEAAKKAGVKRIVMTSSSAAMMPAGWHGGFPYRKVPGAYDPEAHKKTMSEAVWSDVKTVDGYIRAKTVSEQEAWKAMEGSKTEFVTINPVVVWGPMLHKLLWSDSIGMTVDIGMRQPPNNPKALPASLSFCSAFVDVRDVAKAHVKSMLLPQAAGQRYMLAEGVMNMQDANRILDSVFRPMGYNCLNTEMPKCVISCMGCCDPLLARVSEIWGVHPAVDNSKLRRDLLPEMIDLKTSLLDTVYSNVANGRYERKPGFKCDKPEYQGTSGVLKLAAKLD